MKIIVIILFVTLLNSYYSQAATLNCGKGQYVDPCGTCAAKCVKGAFVKQSKKCNEGCICPRGFIMDDNNKCIPITKCKGVPKCHNNEEYVACGPACVSKCSGGYLFLPVCIACCKPGCSCKDGYVKNDKNVCIKIETCIPPKLQ